MSLVDAIKDFTKPLLLYNGRKYRLDNNEIPGIRGPCKVKITGSGGKYSVAVSGMAIFRRIDLRTKVGNTGSYTILNGVNLDDLLNQKTTGMDL